MCEGMETNNNSVEKGNKEEEQQIRRPPLARDETILDDSDGEKENR